jgi:outer membrane immunogenic protein
MKVLIVAATAAAAMAVPALALAQDATGGTSFYGTLGYAGLTGNHTDLGEIQGRLGARFGQYLGVEGEVGAGVKGDKVNVDGVEGKLKLQNQEAIYGVGFLPLSPQVDLLARVGYGYTRVKASALGTSASDSGDSWNYGVGAQYHLDAKNGVRADYTREEFQGSGGGGANVWALAYSRRF